MTDDDRSTGGSAPEGEARPWYFLEDGRPAGPVSFASLAERLLDGRLDGESLVWAPGEDEWLPVADVSELRPLLRRDDDGPPPSASPPPPPEEAEEPGDETPPASPPPPPEGKGAGTDGADGDGSEGDAPGGDASDGDASDGDAGADEPGPPVAGEDAFEKALEEADAEFFAGEELGGEAGAGEEEGAPETPLEAVTAWVEDHVLWSAAVGAALAWALVALLLALGGDGAEEAGQAAAAGASSPPPSAVSAAAVEEVVRGHSSALSDSLAGMEATDPRRDSLAARPGDAALLLRIGFRGLRRLPDSDVLGYAQAWSTLLESVDDATCERLAGWEASSDEIWRALAGLGDARRSALLARLRRAALAEVRGQPAPREPIAEEDLDATFSTFLGRLPPTTADSVRVLLAGEPSCRLDRLLYGAVSELAPPHDRRLARALVTPAR